MSMPASGAVAAVPPALKPRPYRRYLTSALHTRFVHAVLLALFNSLFLAFWTGKDYFWSWFPFGPAGIKAVLFTISSLFVFISQLATMNVGRRTSTSPIATIRSIVFDTSSYQTVFWYVISAWWFCEAYIWAVPEHYNMGWVIRGNPNTPDRLNERPIYLRFFFTVIAIVQSVLHLYFGQSFLHIPISAPLPPQSLDQRTHPVETIQKQLQRKLPLIGLRSLLASGLATIVAPFVYKAFFREFFWRSHLAFAKPFFNLSRSDASPPQTYFIGAILGWAFVVGMALSCMWEIAAHSFLIYLRQAPLKNGLPLSANSQDPNGSLLSGLTAKRSVVRTFALWELALIAQKYPDRRKAIFADFERPSGPMWTLMLKAALSVVYDIDSRILALNSSPPQPSPSQEQQTLKNLPRIAKDASNKPIFAGHPTSSTRTLKVEDFLAVTVNVNPKALGQSRNPWLPPIKESQQKLIEYARPAAGPGGKDLQKSVSNAIKTSPISGLVTTNPARKLSSIILGSPAGNAAIIVDAIEAVTKMLVASLNEDNFGKAAQTVPESVKQFSRTVMMIETYVKVNAQVLTAEDEKELEEVSIIVDRLKAGLRELLAAFQVFLNDAGLGIKDLNEARRASEARPLLPQQSAPEHVNKRPEMQDAGQQQQRRQLGSNDNGDRTEGNTGEQRARDTAQSLRRIESQPTRQRISNGKGNVFGARDFNSTTSRRSRDVEMVH